MGDKETRPQYIRELTNYYKKHVSNMCADCKERIKTKPITHA